MKAHIHFEFSEAEKAAAAERCSINLGVGVTFALVRVDRYSTNSALKKPGVTARRSKRSINLVLCRAIKSIFGNS